MIIMKVLSPFILSVLILAACGRKTSTAIEEPNPDGAKTIDKSAARSVQNEKELKYKEYPAKGDESVQDIIRAATPANDYKAYYDNATRKHNSGDFAGAISDFDKCISLKPDFSDAYNFRAMSKYKSGDKTGACSDWKKAVELGYTRAQNMVDGYCK